MPDLAARPRGAPTAARKPPVFCANVRIDVRVIEQRAAEQRGREHHRGARRGQERFEGRADERTDVAARIDDLVGAVGDLVGPEGHVQQPEGRERHDRPTDRQLHRGGRATAAEECHADGDEHDRKCVPSVADQPAHQGLDATSERTCQIHVHGQPEHDGETDQTDPDELVLAPADGTAEDRAAVGDLAVGWCCVANAPCRRRLRT